MRIANRRGASSRRSGAASVVRIRTGATMEQQMARNLKNLLLFVVAALFLLPGVCFAEVMDKELSLPTIWTAAGALAVVGFVLGRYKIWAAIPVFVFAALLAWDQSSELTDPYVGPAIAH